MFMFSDGECKFAVAERMFPDSEYTFTSGKHKFSGHTIPFFTQDTYFANMDITRFRNNISEYARCIANYKTSRYQDPFSRHPCVESVGEMLLRPCYRKPTTFPHIFISTAANILIHFIIFV